MFLPAYVPFLFSRWTKEASPTCLTWLPRRTTTKGDCSAGCLASVNFVDDSRSLYSYHVISVLGRVWNVAGKGRAPSYGVLAGDCHYLDYIGFSVCLRWSMVKSQQGGVPNLSHGNPCGTGWGHPLVIVVQSRHDQKYHDGVDRRDRLRSVLRGGRAGRLGRRREPPPLHYFVAIAVAVVLAVLLGTVYLAK